MLVAISISPSGGPDYYRGSGGVSESVAEAVRVIRESGLPTETNAMFTNIEGEWDEVMAVVKQAVMTVAETSPRVGLVLKADLRAGHDTGQMTRKVARVEERLAGGFGGGGHLPRPPRGAGRRPRHHPRVRRLRAAVRRRVAARLRAPRDRWAGDPRDRRR